MLHKLYLTAPDKETVDAKLSEWGFVDEEGFSVSRVNVFPVGVIWDVEPEYNEESEVITPGVKVPGYHLNVTCANPEIDCSELVLGGTDPETGEELPTDTKVVQGVTTCLPKTPALIV